MDPILHAYLLEAVQDTDCIRRHPEQRWWKMLWWKVVLLLCIAWLCFWALTVLWGGSDDKE